MKWYKDDWFYSVVDVILALTDSKNPKDYWYKLKTRVNEEAKIELSTICRRLKLLAKCKIIINKIIKIQSLKNLQNELKGDIIININAM